MLTYTLIGPVRCHCGAVSFHVAVCPMCGERVDLRSKSFAPPAYKPPRIPSERSEKSKLTVQWIAASKERKSRAGAAVKEIRAERAAQKDDWATEYLKRNGGPV